MGTLSLSLLGPFHAALGEQPLQKFQTNKVQALLIYLAVETARQASPSMPAAATPEITHRRDVLMTLFWPEMAQEAAQLNLRQTLFRLRRAIPEVAAKTRPADGAHTVPFVLSDRFTVWLNPDAAYELDVALFAQHVRAGLAATSQLEQCQRLERAVALYGGEFLADFFLPDSEPFEAWVQTVRAELQRQHLQALDTITRIHLTHRAFDAALATARRQLASDDLRESAHRQLMLALAHTGHRNEALTHYDEWRALLQAELQVDPAPETQALVEAIRAGHAMSHRFVAQHVQEGSRLNPPFAVLPPTQTPTTWQAQSSQPDILPTQPSPNLPTPQTLFIGRTKEIAQIRQRLVDEPACRLLTLVGMGGTGKTRLALHAAAQLAPAFAHGVYFVSLARVSDPEFFIPTIADALQIALAGVDDPVRTLLHHLRAKEILLILDNFEQLLHTDDADAGLTIPDESAAERGASPRRLLLRLLNETAHLKLLVTSRKRLNVQAEWLLSVQGLSYPQAHEKSDSADAVPSDLNEYGALELFAQRAQRVQPDFDAAAEWAEMVRICQLVEGIPLGIELAAAWTRLMSCAEIVAELTQSLDLLTTSLRDVPSRQRSMRAVFEHSWSLLSVEERTVLARLSVFRGGFLPAAARDVAGGAMLHLAALGDNSLLHRDDVGRHEMHALVRYFAAEKLAADSAAAEQTRDAHCAYYAAFLHARRADLQYRRQKEAMDEISADLDNVRAAWQWAVARAYGPILARAAECLWLYYHMRSAIREAERAFRQAAAAFETPSAATAEDAGEAEHRALRGLLLAGQGLFQALGGAIDAGRAHVERGIEMLRHAPQNTAREEAWVLWWLCFVVFRQGNYLEARDIAEQSLALYTELDDAWGIASSLFLVGNTAHALGHLVQAAEQLRESTERFTALGEQRWQATAARRLGMIALAQGDYPGAARSLHESLLISQQLGDVYGVYFALDQLGALAVAQGQYGQAKQYLQQSLDIVNQTGSQADAAPIVNRLGAVHRLLGEWQTAERLHRESLQTFSEAGNQPEKARCLRNLGALAYARTEYLEAESRFRAALAIWQHLNHPGEIAAAFGDLGHALWAQQDAEAWNYFQRALVFAQKNRLTPVMLDILTGMAHCIAQQENVACAIEVLVVVKNHPAAAQETSHAAARALAELEDQAPRRQQEAAVRRGRQRTVKEIVEMLLGKSGLA